MSCDQNSVRLLKFSLKFQKMKKNVSNVLAKEADGKTSQAFATLSFLFVCVVIGLPLWWITTTVYRARLPFEDIATLSQSELRYTTEFTVIASSEEVKDDDLVEFKRRLGATLELSSQTSSHSLSFQYKVSVRRTFDFEQEIFSSARSLQELENGLAALTVMSDNGRYSLFLLPASSKLLNHDLHLSGFRYMFAKCNREDWHGLVTPVTDVLRQLLVSEKAVQGALHAAAAASKANRSLEQDKASMRAVRSSPQYDVVLSLLNPRPDLVNAIWEPSHGKPTSSAPSMNRRTVSRPRQRPL
ncbi:PREDICTED: GPI transamidase component PIG-S-like [Priapulus caudatus]|uniref:GPI transamidase component PIG-S-like n=1 Tax=Priapulus caudatus TaxID=37621 RepID=A0ABM1EZ21_PRICU|nr:PREDICTED: GPI transamidase component PIG-S-like [Priapulus caudatus]